MESEARHHHYISQTYLRGFAQRRERKQKPAFFTQVTDFRQLKTFEANVRNVGGERDFNRVEIPGYEPTVVETALSAFEGSCTDAMKRVAASRRFEGEDANLTLNFMAVLAVRSPENRENVREFHERVHKGLLATITRDEETWQATTAGMKADGVPVNTAISYEDARSFSQRGEFDVAVPREYHMRLEFDLANKLLELLGRRVWTLYTVDGNEIEFITTDRPVTLAWVNPPTTPSFLNAPGFGLANTEVLFPLSRKAALIGRWDKGGGTQKAGRLFAAAFNTRMLQHSGERAFSASKRMLYLGRQSVIHEDHLLIDNFMSWNGRSKPAEGAGTP